MGLFDPKFPEFWAPSAFSQDKFLEYWHGKCLAKIFTKNIGTGLDRPVTPWIGAQILCVKGWVLYLWIELRCRPLHDYSHTRTLIVLSHNDRGVDALITEIICESKYNGFQGCGTTWRPVLPNMHWIALIVHFLWEIASSSCKVVFGFTYELGMGSLFFRYDCILFCLSSL